MNELVDKFNWFIIFRDELPYNLRLEVKCSAYAVSFLIEKLRFRDIDRSILKKLNCFSTHACSVNC